MSAGVTAALIALATAPALGLVWMVAVLARRQAEQNRLELEQDKAEQARLAAASADEGAE